MIALGIALCLFLGDTANTVPLNTGFLVVDGVYNTELTAPFDILEHSKYRKQAVYFRCFLVSPDGRPVTTAEGLTLSVDYSFENCPALDVLVVPSTMTSMDKDLAEGPYLAFVKRRAAEAAVVMSLCDGAFPLAAAGLLDGKHATTFPGDRRALAARFPQTTVHHDVWFVQDGKCITSVGGARSFEPALFLADQWFGPAYAQALAEGLVLDWNPSTLPHKTFAPLPKRPKSGGTP